MKQVQWFPGHMSKALREIKENLKKVDIVFILLDARLPESSMNPKIKEIIGNKPALILFNKSSLADQSELDKWLNFYQKEGFSSLKIDAITGKNIRKIKPLSDEILKPLLEKEKKRGMQRRAIRTMIIGIPNVGKSTLINTLSRKKATRTGNTPGVTKAQQWVKISEDFELLDTPGVLWPKFEDEKVGYHLALSGAIKDTILPNEEIAFYAHHFLKTYYKEELKKRYQLNEVLEPIDTFSEIGRKRGALIKGNEVNYDTVYELLLKDLRDGNLGGITFDRYQSL
ncbi:Ribosome biogenesis GTP-binding protein YlqF [Paracholeplasma brassicae]|uniref:Ribosome biogenesis GTPase A n=1 Tax=Acholeplasma brassicae TaxID=61635 RepID=U4KRD5_9MOLU|nr:ribosome biogenesis GTPase YlqF [Paracholeplasma brassicae]CCV65653.1 Ribosome biogenesis GTP-binding protein YlqF [Paracholeplasma brassicae]